MKRIPQLHVFLFCLLCVLFPTLDGRGPGGANLNLGVPFPVFALKGVTLTASTIHFAWFSALGLIVNLSLALGVIKAVALLCRGLAPPAHQERPCDLRLERLLLIALFGIALQNFPAFTATVDSLAGFVIDPLLRAAIVYGVILVVLPAVIISAAVCIRNELRPRFPIGSIRFAWGLAIGAFLSYSVVGLM
jgi:hypothetical protein